jgi:hypothetical protein
MRRLSFVGLLFVVSVACHDIESTNVTPTGPMPPVSPTTINLSMSPGQLPVGGGTAFVYVETTGGSQPAANVRVSLRASSGELSASDVRTDTSGHATVTWTGKQTATLTAEAGSLSRTYELLVTPPATLPPPSTPPPPSPVPPPPTPPPTPPPVPTFTVTLTPERASTPVNTDVGFLVAVSNLQAGETVMAYQWDCTGDGTIDATTTTPGRRCTYAAHGVFNPSVRVRTSLDRDVTATTRIVVTN